MNRPALVTGALVVVALVFSERGGAGEGDVERTTLSGGESPKTAPDLVSANGFSRTEGRIVSKLWGLGAQAPKRRRSGGGSSAQRAGR